jgi:hypothetical protein
MTAAQFITDKEEIVPDSHGRVPLERLPDHIVASMKARARWVADLAESSATPGGFEYLIGDLQSWRPGQTVRVAFLGGSKDLHQKIEEATQTITDVANLTLSFRHGDALRTWKESHEEYAAEIRVSFDQEGYFSLVGTDSVSSLIGKPAEPVGGRPYQRSLNLEGFDRGHLPVGWRGTVRHEFLHALGFLHEHQNMRGPCQDAFRWDDDPGYQRTKDEWGSFTADAEGRRPGLYTYMSGPPDSWDRKTIDHNLRTDYTDPKVAAGPFDASSIMLYDFDPSFYKTVPSPCAPIGDRQELSEGDIRALRLLYPQEAMSIDAVNQRRQDVLNTVESASEGGFESVSVYERDAIQRLQIP